MRPAQTESAWTGGEIFVTCRTRARLKWDKFGGINFMAAKQSGGWVKWAGILLIVSAGIAAGVWASQRGKSDAPQYQTTPVERGELTKVVTATGTLNPVVNVTVGSQVSGRISKLNVDFNSVVKSNEII